MKGHKITRYFSIRIYTENLICHRLSKNFFEPIPAFWQKNVRCTVEMAHDAVNKNFTFLEVSIWQKFVRCKARGKNQNENLQKIYIKVSPSVEKLSV